MMFCTLTISQFPQIARRILEVSVDTDAETKPVVEYAVALQIAYSCSGVKEQFTALDKILTAYQQVGR